jgi:NADPH:quinone reductase-like Zn-dependent oxidoreductase
MFKMTREKKHLALSVHRFMPRIPGKEASGTVSAQVHASNLESYTNMQKI